MSSEELKSYSDSLQASDSSLTNAADVIAIESVEPIEKPDENSGLSMFDLRAKAKSLAQVGSSSNTQQEEETPVINAAK